MERLIPINKLNICLKIWVVLVILVGVSGLQARAETITLTTYYPSPFGVYDELKVNKYLPLYDSGWIEFPLVDYPNKTKSYFLELEHNLGTSDTVVQIETKVISRRSVDDFKKAFGYVPLAYGPIIYNIIKRMKPYEYVAAVRHIPLYTKDENRIIITMEPLLEPEEPIEFLIRVVMWGY
jgi:hypothetical protein